MTDSIKPEIICQENPALHRVAALEGQIPEFASLPKIRTVAQRTAGRDTIILLATLADASVGYAVAYDRDGDGSFYIWLAAVVPEYRGKGVWSALFTRLKEYARQKNYDRLTIKTRNRFRTMLSYLVHHGWLITGVIPNDQDPRENEICAYLPLGR